MCSRIGIKANPGLLCCEFRPTLRLSGSPVQKLNLSSCHSVTHNRYIYFCCVLVISSQQRDTRPPGGAMTAEEAETFEKLPMFTAILRMRKWDDLGKNPDAALQPLEKYRTLCRKYLRELFGS